VCFRMDGAAIYFLKVKHILTIVLHEYAKKIFQNILESLVSNMLIDGSRIDFDKSKILLIFYYHTIIKEKQDISS
jgi:hypothetical protein